MISKRINRNNGTYSDTDASGALSSYASLINRAVMSAQSGSDEAINQDVSLQDSSDSASASNYIDAARAAIGFLSTLAQNLSSLIRL